MSKNPMDPDDALWQAVTHNKRQPDPEQLGDIVASLERAGLSKKEIGARLGVSARSVQRWTTAMGRRSQARDAGESPPLAAYSPRGPPAGPVHPP
ncbi:helix-turn-helix domain-containing protein [Streptacidiphilus rugosus]|uniref:helix-turn-helix domain-containing protein n=1 Tax=Streptacidiphilus rugosus TaxID=405783 RepID=UPI0012F97E15|nr:helix-turn-helix domain-containing protein [Streptacidiphilus rugosus]